MSTPQQEQEQLSDLTVAPQVVQKVEKIKAKNRIREQS